MIPVNDLTATVVSGGEIFVVPVLGIDQTQCYVILQGRLHACKPLTVSYPYEDALRDLDRERRYTIHRNGKTEKLESRRDDERGQEEWDRKTQQYVELKKNGRDKAALERLKEELQL